MPIIILFLAIALQIFLTAKKLNPFLSFLIASVLAGLALGMKPDALIKSIETGVGSTMAGLVLIICLGAILGKVLEVSGAIEKIAGSLINSFGERNIQWALVLTGFLVGMPLYYNAGFIILVPLVFTMAIKTKLPLLYIAIPTAASLSTAHCFLPPHPGPVVLINGLGADTGRVLLYGILIAIPTIIVAGPLLGQKLQHMKVATKSFFVEETQKNERQLPSSLPSFLIALMPVLLITMSVLATAFLQEGLLKTALLFIGNSNIALLLSVLLAIYFFGIRKGVALATISKWSAEAIAGISMVLMIIAAGGVLRQILTDSGTGNYIASFSTKWNMPPLLFAWLITAVLRVAVGSSTVAGVTAVGIVAPLVAAGNISPELMVLAVGSGSVFGSHVNDTGFWMFKEFFNLSLKQTFLSWTVMESLISVLGLGGVLLLQLFLKL
jgi:Gnt-I system high-affinity gluconate transporter